MRISGFVVVSVITSKGNRTEHKSKQKSRQMMRMRGPTLPTAASATITANIPKKKLQRLFLALHARCLLFLVLHYCYWREERSGKKKKSSSQQNVGSPVRFVFCWFFLLKIFRLVRCTTVIGCFLLRIVVVGLRRIFG